MDKDDHILDSFYGICPYCECERGIYKIRGKECECDTITHGIYYRCDKCGGEWTVIKPEESDYKPNTGSEIVDALILIFMGATVLDCGAREP